MFRFVRQFESSHFIQFIGLAFLLSCMVLSGGCGKPPETTPQEPDITIRFAYQDRVADAASIIAVEKGAWKIHETEFHSKAKYSPFDGRQVLARTVMTIVGGEIVYKDGDFIFGSGTAGRVPVRKSI